MSRRGDGGGPETDRVRAADAAGAGSVPVGVKVLDVAVYAVALTALVAAVGVAVGALRGNGPVAAKHLLFWVGFLLLGLGSWKLRPEPAWNRETRLTLRDSRRASPFQRALHRLPPLSRYELPRDRLPSDGLKFLAGSLAMLATSAAMEFLLGVR